MIDFSTLQGLTIPEGVVTKIECGGVVLWQLQTAGPIVLEVEKITSDTYAGERTYTGEQFILLDIYPKTNGTVSVTYGGLTKTITDTSGATSPNSQRVYFGEFNGVSDEVETPASGTLTIEGQCLAFANGCFAKSSKSSTNYCGCITAIIDFGNIKSIANSAFRESAGLKSVVLPNGVTEVAGAAFMRCSGLTSLTIPESVSKMCAAYNYTNGLIEQTFIGCDSLESIVVDEKNLKYASENGILYNKAKSCVIRYPPALGHYEIPAGIKEIGNNAFQGCTGLTSATIPEGVETICMSAFDGCSGLTDVIIPESVTGMGVGVFTGCTNLSRIVILAKTPPVIASRTFEETTCQITVPAGCGEVYKTESTWSTLADRIVEAS